MLAAVGPRAMEWQVLAPRDTSSASAEILATKQECCIE